MATQTRNGLTSNYSYDPAGRLTLLKHQNGGTTLGEFGYTLNARGDRTQAYEKLAKSGGGNDEQTIVYAYDGLARVSSATYYAGATTGGSPTRIYNHAFDVASNRTQQVVTIGSATTTDYEYDAANRITRSRVNAGSWTNFTYDNAGRLTNDGTNSYTWDRVNRLLSMGGASYTYDGAGRRVSQTVSGNTTKYLLDIGMSLWETLVETTGANTTRYVHSMEGLLSQQRPDASWQWMMNDGLGSLRGVVNNSLSPQESRMYAPYGDATQLSGSSQTSYGFTGEPKDSNDLLYLLGRYYRPSIGQFISLDPLETPNRYGYVSGNVVNMVDPSGLVGTIRPRMIDEHEGRAVIHGGRVTPRPTTSSGGRSTSPIPSGARGTGTSAPGVSGVSNNTGGPRTGPDTVSTNTSGVGAPNSPSTTGLGSTGKTVFGSSTKGKSTSTSNSNSPFSRRLSQCLPEWLAFIYSWDFPITIAFPWESGCDAETENTGSAAIDIDDLGNKCYHLDLGACDELSRLCHDGIQRACEKLSAAYRGDCSPWVYKPMKERKDNSCERIMRCEPYMPCDVLLTLYGLADDCVTIRWNITLICYRGVEDDGHRTARYNAMNRRNRCREIYLDKVERGQC